MTQKSKIFTLYNILNSVYRKGRVSKTELNEMLGSARRCDLWLQKVLLKDKLLARIQVNKVEYYRLDDIGLDLLKALSKKECFDALCFTKGERLAECTWVKPKLQVEAKT